MSTRKVTRSHDASILGRLVQPEQPTLAPEAARAILELHFGPSDVERMNELASKARKGTLTEDERHETESYERIGSFVGLMQSKARRSLQRAKRNDHT